MPVWKNIFYFKVLIKPRLKKIDFFNNYSTEFKKKGVKLKILLFLFIMAIFSFFAFYCLKTNLISFRNLDYLKNNRSKKNYCISKFYGSFYIYYLLNAPTIAI